MDPVPTPDLPVEGLADERAVRLIGAHHHVPAHLFRPQLSRHEIGPGGDLSLQEPGLQHGEHRPDHRIGDDARIPDQAHLPIGLLILDPEVEVLRVHHVFRTEEAFEVTDDPVRDHLSRREQRDAVHPLTRGCLDHLLEALGLDRVLLIRELQQLYLVNGRARARRELLGDVAAFQPGDDVEALRANHSGDLLDRDIGVSTQVRHVAVVMLI